MTEIHLFHLFLKISDPLIDLCKIIGLLGGCCWWGQILWFGLFCNNRLFYLRSYEILILLLLFLFLHISLPYFFQDLLSLFRVSSDCTVLVGTLVAATLKSPLALLPRSGLNSVNLLSLLKDCFFRFYGLRSRHWIYGLRSRHWIYDLDNRRWVWECATLCVALRTPLALLCGGLLLRRINNRSWWLDV